MSDYQRVEHVIRYLVQHQHQQPSLQDLADEMEISPFHLHRIFTRWAGLTPKAFLKCLTLADAKQRLASGESVLDAALASGLSGPGRLHDLCVHIEAATPGELKSGGGDWTIRYGLSETPFGTCLAGLNERGICHLSFSPVNDDSIVRSVLNEQWPKAALKRNDEEVGELVSDLFSGNTAKQPLCGIVRGSEFQVKVWRALLGIPFGIMRSYTQIANEIGMPGASRAVGSAIAKNELAFLIPCHRVIRGTGATGEYRWGPERKKAMLAWEYGQCVAPSGRE